MEDINKVERGQFYTTQNPFKNSLFAKWVDAANIQPGEPILEPFAGSNNILRLMYEAGYDFEWRCYDIEPSQNNTMDRFQINQQDTIQSFPTGFRVCITNPPYLGKVSARKRNIEFPWKEDDMYKVCLNRMLDNCEYVAAIIPESFITQGMAKSRLFGIISLATKMFDDTECPVCLALFKPDNGSENDFDIFRNDTRLGSFNELNKYNVGKSSYPNKINWKLNDPKGSVGAITVDNKEDNCRFIPGDMIDPSKIKISSRTSTRISGLPEDIDLDTFIDKCNSILHNYRQKTNDVFLTSFRGLRYDGTYRRRLDFETLKNIMDLAYQQMIQ